MTIGRLSMPAMAVSKGFQDHRLRVRLQHTGLRDFRTRHNVNDNIIAPMDDTMYDCPPVLQRDIAIGGVFVYHTLVLTEN